MLNRHEIQRLPEDKTKVKVFGSDGEKIGTLGQIYLDDESGAPNFATVHTGLFGMAENFVPLDEAEVSAGALYVKFPKDCVKDAPNLDPAAHISEMEEERLYSYYAQAGGGSAGPVVAPASNNATTPFAAGECLARNDSGSTRPRLRKYVHSEEGSYQSESVDAEIPGLKADPLAQAAARSDGGIEGRSVDPQAGWPPQEGSAEDDAEATGSAPESNRFGRRDRLGP